MRKESSSQLPSVGYTGEATESPRLRAGGWEDGSVLTGNEKAEDRLAWQQEG